MYFNFYLAGILTLKKRLFRSVERQIIPFLLCFCKLCTLCRYKTRLLGAKAILNVPKPKGKYTVISVAEKNVAKIPTILYITISEAMYEGLQDWEMAHCPVEGK